MKNILVSSTRQWNCGDEFIWYGIRRLLNESGIKANYILFNRHPDVQPRFRLLHSLKRSRDNSFFLDQAGGIDYAVFAGTPEWHSNPMVNPMLKYINDEEIRTSFIGVGLGTRIPEISPLLSKVLNEYTDLLIARDKRTYELISEYKNATQDVCPSIFSAPHESVCIRENLKRVGIVIQASDLQWHNIPESTKNSLWKQYQAIEKEHSVEYIAHYIDDWKYACNLGIEGRTHYSSFSEDYFEIYHQFDFIISTRVHGCGIAGSLGVPSIIVPHDGRAGTAEGFLSTVVKEDESILKALNQINIEEKSREVIQHRKQRHQEYLKKISDVLVPRLSETKE